MKKSLLVLLAAMGSFFSGMAQYVKAPDFCGFDQITASSIRTCQYYDDDIMGITITYQIEIHENASFSGPGVSRVHTVSTQSVAPKYFIVSYLNPNTYYYRVKARLNQTWGPYGSTRSFQIGSGCSPPTATITSGPTSACVNATGNLYSTQFGKSNYVWTISGGTITSGGNSSSNTATVTWTSPGTRTIQVKYDQNGCTSTTATRNVSVNYSPASYLSGPATVCVGSTGNVYSTQSGRSNYVWAISGGVITSGGASGSSTATVTWNSSGSRWIEVSYNYGSCTTDPERRNVGVKNLTTGSIGGAQTICYNSDPGILTNSTSPSNNNGTISYQWQSSTNGSSGWTNISGATSSTYDPPSGLTADRWYRRAARDACNVWKYTSSIKVTVKNLSAGSIGNAQTICYNGDPAILSNSSSPSNNNGTISYQWQYSVNGTSGWTNISGATSSTYDPPSGLTADRWYRRAARDACNVWKYTSSVKVTVKNLTAGSIGGTQTICYNSDPGMLTNNSSASNNNGTISYQWQYSTNGSSGWTNISGATSSTYDPPSGLTADRWYRRRAKDACNVWKNTSSVKVSVKNLASGSISGVQTICYGGDPTTLTNSTSPSNNNGSISYQWQYSDTGTSAWTNISGATNSTYDPPSGLTADRWYRRRAKDACNVWKNTSGVKVTVGPSVAVYR